MQLIYPLNRRQILSETGSNTIFRTIVIVCILFAQSYTSHATNWYVSGDGQNSLTNQNGQSPENPLKTISFAFNQAAEPGDTVFVMNGTYRNAGYGSGSHQNNPAVYLNNSGTEGFPIVLTNMPGHEPLVEFDGAGGFVANQIKHIEISGFTVVGPGENITTDEAMEQRLELPRPNYYNGRGIAIWGPAHHITISNNTVSYAPGSGIRVNKGDYIHIAHNRIFHNCWYTSAAESALVIAEATSINDVDTIKIRLVNNKVWGNQNKIPFFTPNPPDIGVQDYGTAEQDFIIDGSGVYVTRNKEYDAGWFYLANNISFNNGINGLVVHRTDRAIAVNNTCYMNGATPLESGRQNSSGLTINNSRDVRIFNNISYARYPEDFALGQYGDLYNIEMEANIIFNGNTPFSEGYTYADPLFMNADTIESTADFSLNENSPAVDQGVMNQWVPEYDFAGNPRIENPDIGALEYSESLFSTDFAQHKNPLHIFPNPSSHLIHIELGKKNAGGEVTVWDVHGRRIINQKMSSDRALLIIDVSEWEKGIYMVQHKHKKHLTTKKMIIN